MVGHEITHILEGTDLYESLAMAITEYAKKKGEYESRMQQIRDLYEGKEGYTGEDAEAKLEAELVGDYIFTDKQFVEKLFTENRNLFQRIYDEIKYLCKLVTAGSKEARLLEKSKKMFAEAVNEAKQEGVKNPTEEGGELYSIQKDVVDVNGKIYAKVVKPGLTVYQSVKHNRNDYISHLREKIFKRRFNLKDINGKEITVEFARSGETVQKDGSKNPHPVLGEFESSTDRLKMIAIINIKDLIKNSEPIKPKNENSHQKLDAGGWNDRIAYMEDHGYIYPVIIHIPLTADGRYLLYDLSVLKKEKSRIDMDATALAAQSARAPDSKENGMQSAVLVLDSSNKKISQPGKKVNKKSLSDSDGNQLSAGQMEFFQDSKVRDKNGNLKVMYHGSPAAFTVFDKKKARSGGYYGKGFYFTDSDSHAKQYGNAYKVYLNITNPLQDGTNNITKDQLRNFVEAIAENEDYGLDNYGYGATVDSVVNSVYGKRDFAMLMDLNASSIGNMVEAIELFNEVNGTDYNGIIAPTETVAFYPNQIKSVTNTNPTKNEDINLSLSYDKQAETTGGGWNVRGRDISLPGYQESPVAETETGQTKQVNLPGLEKSQPKSQGKAQEVNLPMPKQTPKDQQTAAREALHEALFGKQQTEIRPAQQTTQQEVEDLDAEYRRQMFAYSASNANTVRGVPKAPLCKGSCHANSVTEGLCIANAFRTAALPVVFYV